MSAKVSNLEELSGILTKKEKRDGGILHFSKQFKIGHLLKPFCSVKQQGLTLMSILVALILCRLGGVSVYAAQKTGNLHMDDNTMYRLMNNPLINWKSIILSFARQFLRCAAKHGTPAEQVAKCFVIDDTEIEKTGKTFEGISRIFSHVTHSYKFGFKKLALCFWDGKSLIPCGFSLHRESKKNEYGLNKKQQKRQFHGNRKHTGYFQQYFNELDEEKNKAAVRMLKRTVKSGILASYVLMDSWFVSDYMLQSIRAIRGGLMHVVGICKMDSRRFEVNGKSYNSHTIIKMNEFSKSRVHVSRKFHSKYMTVPAKYNGMDVKLFYLKYKRSEKWTLLLTTDLSLSFVKAMELYRIRWSIEVMFKECKQYLRLGKSQNTDLCGQIADASLTLITCTILELYKRFEDYETLGELFRTTQEELLERTLCGRIARVFLRIVADLLEFFSIDVEESMRRLIEAKASDRRLLILLNAINQLDENSDDL
jgi:hypothetical protein